jgi:hypothetical protein
MILIFKCLWILFNEFAIVFVPVRYGLAVVLCAVGGLLPFVLLMGFSALINSVGRSLLPFC